MRNAELSGMTEWVVSVIESIGEIGVGALIALENVFPPIPSEVVLPFAGFSASQGELQPMLTWAAATVGAVVGAYVLYGIGALVGHEQAHELSKKRWFILFSESDLRRGERFFDKHGDKVVLFGRCIPLVRSIVSVPAGFTHMPLIRFTVLTAIGSGVWNALFIYAGYRLGDNWADVQEYMKPVAYAVGVALVIGLVALAVRRHRKS